MSTTAVKKKPRPSAINPPCLDDVCDDISQGGNIIVLHTPPGFGKTSVFANVPNNIFMLTDDETGLFTLMRNKQVPKTKHFPNVLNTFTEIKIGIKELLLKEHNYRFLTIDTFTGAVKTKEEELINQKYGGDPTKFAAFGGTQSVKDTVAEVKLLMRDFRKLAEQKGMTIVLLCHTTIKNFNNPDGNNYNRFAPDMHNEVWAVVNKLADIVLFGTFEVFVETAKGADISMKGKAKGGATRLIKTEWNASYEAKNRHGLSPTIVCGKSAAETAAILGKEITKNRTEETLETLPAESEEPGDESETE